MGQIMAMFFAVFIFRQGSMAAPGALDTGFSPAAVATNSVHAIAVYDSASLLVGGWVHGTNATGSPYAGIVRLGTNGVLDTTFQAAPLAACVTAIALSREGQILYAGRQIDSLDAIVRRLDPNGSLDSTLSVNFGGVLSPWVHAVAVQNDSRILVAGHFTTANGEARTNLVRLREDGTLDSSFKTNFTAGGAILAVVLQEDGKILIGGSFTNINRVSRKGIARLNTDGSLDLSFNPLKAVDGVVKSIRIQADQRILIAGHFFRVDETRRSGIARLLPSGALDATFDPGAGVALTAGGTFDDAPSVDDILIQGDGRLVIGGRFDEFDGSPRSNLARLNWDGSLDSNFDPGVGANSAVRALAVQADGRLLIGGDFTAFAGLARQRIARLQSDGTDPVAPTILTAPVAQTIIIRGTARFLVEAEGTPALSYQWLKSGLPLSGQTNDTLVIRDAQYADAGFFSVTVSNAGGTTTSTPVALYVTPAPEPPSIVSEPEDLLVPAGSSLALPAAATGAQPMSWQWRRGGKDITGATANVLSFDSVRTNDAGSYVAVVTNAGGLDATRTVGLAVFVPPASQTIASGSNLVLRVQAYGPGPFSYLWRFNGSALPGAVGSSLIRTNALLADQGAYSVIIANPSCAATSEVAQVVVQMPPLITAGPEDQEGVLGGTNTLSVTAVGSPSLRYQWRAYGTNLPAATNATLTLGPLNAGSPGYYSVVVANDFGSATSRIATVTVAGPVLAEVRLEDGAASAGEILEVSLNLVSRGDENTVGFSATFDPSLLTLRSISNGISITPGVSVLLNTKEQTKGRIGGLIAQSSGAAFTPGTNHLLTLNFQVGASLTRSMTTSVAFASSPVEREVISATVRPLAAQYHDAEIVVDAGYEGDVAAEPFGDGQLTASDWTLLGRFVSGLSKPANLMTFVRADCAPVETAGDGRLTAADWTQAGRFVTGLDTPGTAGGPAGGNGTQSAMAGLSETLSGTTSSRRKVRLMGVSPRRLSIATTPAGIGDITLIGVDMTAAGDENVAAFSLSFDATRLRFLDATPGQSLGAGAIWILNTNAASEGRIGVLLGKQAGQTFKAGAHRLLSMSFLPVSAGHTTEIRFLDAPVVREVVSPSVRVLPAAYESGWVEIAAPANLGAPVRTARLPSGGVRMTWEIARPGEYVLESSSDLIVWEVLRSATFDKAGEIEFEEAAPQLHGQRFFRLR